MEKPRKKNINKYPNMRSLIPSGFVGEMEIVIPGDIINLVRTWEITRRLYITHIGLYPNAKDHFREREKGAEQYVFIYCDKGKGIVTIEDETVTLNKNSFIILPPRKYHNYISDEKNPWTIYWLHFDGVDAYLFNSIIGVSVEISESYTSRILERLQIFAEMYRILEKGFDRYNLEYITFCLFHFLATLKYILAYRESKTMKNLDRVEMAKEYMKANIKEKLSLADIAKVIGYSVPHLIALFKKDTSLSPIDYFAKLKLEVSCTYLKDSDLKIKEIAFKLNYYDQFHFTKMFIKEYGITPSEYRNRLKT